ncbi:hypothetical protein A359_08070 [secondary endosymbiont of Ctenarytaina eucalypti]|uniref:Uncharacterized protein n=1 Tax=secondary endosymbiont of Ctenarytaina eucalypti TaxID=1199245 RepID=J3YSF0_9ENTR|nr:hypothetical protein A359_08070 [secondary endosymbiont of Ctenarytaina eucalypti]
MSSKLLLPCLRFRLGRKLLLSSGLTRMLMALVIVTLLSGAVQWSTQLL